MQDAKGALSYGNGRGDRPPVKTGTFPAASQPWSPAAIADPQRIKKLLPVGSTHVLHTKGGMAGTLQPGFHWSLRRRLQVVYAFESLVRRTIESNDGTRIVEVRHFEKVHMARLFSESENLKLDLGPPAKRILESFDDANRVGTRKVDPGNLADAILLGGVETIAAYATNRAYVQTDSLSGKTVRITYVDGQGVVSVEPLDCTLPDSVRQFLMHTPVLADAYLAPGSLSRSGKQAGVDARQLGCLLAPSLRKVPQGELQLAPLATDHRRQPAAVVRLFPSTGQSAVGNDTVPTGIVTYDSESQRIQSLALEGRFVEFERGLNYPQECNWHMSLYPRKQLMYRFNYCCEPARRKRDPYRGSPPPRSAESLAGNSGSTPSATGHLAGLGWQGPAPAGKYDDLDFARLILLAAALACFRCGMRVASRCGAFMVGSVVLAVVAATFLFGVFMHGQLWIARWAPLSNVIVLGNLLPLGAAFLTGILGAQDRIPVWRRAVLILFLVVPACYTLASSFPAANRDTRHLWSLDAVSLQTGAASCSACAAATLLADHGIPANEQEMAGLCLTKPNGTPILGLFRGLKLKARQSGWDVEVFRCGFEQLRREGRFPVLLPVRVGELTVVGSNRNQVRLSQMEARSHAVVLFGFTPDGRAELGDPSRTWDNGRVLWPAEELRAAYCGEGLRLVKR